MNPTPEASRRPHILITNDDGIDSPGLIAAVHAVVDLGDVTVVAPTSQQTARGRSLQGNRSDFLHPVSLPGLPDSVVAYHIDASPALVVRHTLMTLFNNRKPDLIVAGINYGENLGSGVTTSGTVGAALQGAAQGVVSIAVSRQTGIEHHYEYGELDWKDSIRVVHKFAERMLNAIRLDQKLPFDVLKIDVPDPCPADTIERLTVLSQRQYYITRYRDPHPSSRIDDSSTAISIDPELLNPADDIYAVAVDRVVSITPLSLDCTAALLNVGQLLGI